ncbi:MAG: diacylglycerol kinase family protein [Anaerolineales bacterium]|jgi:YegS/Rv2252/BmrU family lipid kinase
MPKVKMIFNPQADRGGAARIESDLGHLTDELGGADWIATDYRGHAIQIAEQAGREGFDPVVAVGGDGTVHEVVNGLMRLDAERRPRLGIVPIGSGNDFAGGIGVLSNPLQALQSIFSSNRAMPFDVGFIRDDQGRLEYWVNVVGIGFDAAVNLQSRNVAWVRGFLMYLLAVIRVIIQNYDAPRMEIQLDDQTFQKELLMFTVGNGTREGGGFITTPAARFDDGVLDFATVAKVSRLMMFRLIPEVMRGTHGRFKAVTIGRLRHLRLKADRALPIHVDGETYATYEADVRGLEVGLVPAGLRLVL